MMKYIYQLLFTAFLLLLSCYVFAQDNNFQMGGAANQLRININSGGSYCVYRENIPGDDSWVRQFFSSSTPMFSIRIGTIVFQSTSTNFTVLDGEAVTEGVEQIVTKNFLGVYNGQSFSVQFRILYNTSNPSYMTQQATIDATNILAGTSISLAYGFDAYVNGCDGGAAITVPNLGHNTIDRSVNLSQAEVRSLRMVGGINDRNSGSLIAFFPMGRVFDRAYSAYFGSAYSYSVINQTNNLFKFGPYAVPSCDGASPWDNGIGVVYDDIPAGEITDIRTGLSFTQDLDGELDYTWNGNKNLIANLGDNIDLRLRYSSYNSEILTNVGFRVNLPGLKIRSGGCLQNGFNSGNFDCIVGNEYYQVINGNINSLAIADISVPVQVTQCGQWSIDGDAISNMVRTLPLGTPAVLTVKSTVGFAETETTYLHHSSSTNITVKFPDGVTPAQDAVVNLNYSGATSSFSPTPATVTIPAGQNSVTFTITAASNAVNGEKLIMSLSSSSTGFIDIGKNESMTFMVTSHPDNVIEDANCFTAPPITNWQPTLNKISSAKIHILAQLFVGDIDGDGASEVVTTNQRLGGNGYTYSDSILIFDQDLNIKTKIRVSSGTNVMYTNSATPIVLLKLKESNPRSLIITAAGEATGNKSKLYAYECDGTLVWTSEDIFIYSSSVKAASVCLVAGDINNDGIPEILAGDRIFDAETGALIATLPDGYGRGARNLNGTIATQNYTYMPALADVDNDGKLEVVAGNVTYKIDIVDRNDASKNSVQILAPANGGIRDGFVSIADINLDGKDDVVVVSTDGAKPILTVWDGNTGDIIAGPKSPDSSNLGQGGSRAFIGNVDDDMFPEIFFSYVNRLIRFDYDPNAANVADRLVQKWVRTTTDTSGGTTLSMFDFDQNGKAELVYRDETHLRIIDGETGDNKQTIPCHSRTHSEYPIIVDFDRDGHADILVSGAADLVSSNANDIRIYRFSGVNSDWAPARTVWNQHGYNSVHVNEDLTIPRAQFKISTLFPGRDGVFGTADDVRPFNGYLLQQTFLSKNGVPYYLTPNAKIIDNDQIGYDYDSDSGVLNISNLKISNVGDALLQSPVKITVYKGEVLPANKIFTYDYQSAVAINETKIVNFDVPNFKNFLPINSDLVIRVNDAGTGFNDQLVCDSCCVGNETESFAGLDFDKLAWADSYRKCIGDNVLFNTLAFVGDSLRYKWMLPNTTNIFSTMRQPSISNLDLDDAGRYIFVAENINNNLTVKYTLPYLSVAPPLMSWRQDAVDHNWNNLNNWRDGAGNLIQAIPAGCTDVHIPGGALKYPSLDTINSPIAIYGSPVSKDITFHYGGQIAFPHKLDYKKAFVQYNWRYYESFVGVTPNQQPTKNIDGTAAPYLNRGQWYMLSAPLKKMASGDFALAGYPLTWQALINREEGLFEKVNFSSPFATNDIDLSTKNNAIVVKVAPYNTNVGYANHRDLEGLKGVIEVPYFENDAKAKFYPGHIYDPLSQISTFFYFNNKTLQQIASPVGRMKRGQEAYRFIFEKEDSTASTVTVAGKTVPGYKLNVSTHGGSSASDSEGRATIMIGNPYMSSINAKRFFDANEGNLNLLGSAGYKIFDAATQTWVSMPYSATNYIQPLQAFVVTIQDAVTELVFPLEGDYAVTEAGPVVSSGTFMAQGESLFVKANVVDESSISNYAILSSDNQLADIKKTIHPDGHAAPEAFFVSPNGRDYNLVQLYNKDIKEIKLGVKSSNVDEVLALNFENVAEFALYNNVYPILVDKLLNIQQPLLDNPVYRFNQQSVNSASEYANTVRFTLLLDRSNEGGGIDQAESINVIYGQKYLKVSSNHDLAQIEVYSVLGQKVHYSGTLSANILFYEKYLPLTNGVYVVKVTTIDGKLVIKKVIAL